jgi:hypothetical protein
MSVASPLEAFGIYIAALSFTSNVGQAITPNLFAHLDNDPLFCLSTSGLYAASFQNFYGPLDMNGNSPLITVPFPNDPSLACLPIKAQFAVLDVMLVPRATNQLNFSVLP